MLFSIYCKFLLFLTLLVNQSAVVTAAPAYEDQIPSTIPVPPTEVGDNAFVPNLSPEPGSDVMAQQAKSITQMTDVPADLLSGVNDILSGMKLNLESALSSGATASKCNIYIILLKVRKLIGI